MHNFRKKKNFDPTMPVLISLHLSETFFILRITEQDINTNVYWSSLWCPFFLWDYNEAWIFLIHFRKIFKHQISWKSVQWQPNCFTRSDRRTDVTNILVAFTNKRTRQKCYNRLRKTYDTMSLSVSTATVTWHSVSATTATIKLMV